MLIFFASCIILVVLSLSKSEDSGYYLATGAELLLLAAVGTSIAGTGIMMYGQREEGKAAKKLGKFNQTLANQEAQETEAAAKDALVQNQRQARLAYAERKAALGQGGFSLEGSSSQMLSDLEYQLRRETTNAYQNAISRAYGLRSEAARYRFEGDFAKRAATYKMIGTGLQGASDLASFGVKSSTKKGGT